MIARKLEQPGPTCLEYWYELLFKLCIACPRFIPAKLAWRIYRNRNKQNAPFGEFIAYELQPESNISVVLWSSEPTKAKIVDGTSLLNLYLLRCCRLQEVPMPIFDQLIRRPSDTPNNVQVVGFDEARELFSGCYAKFTPSTDAPGVKIVAVYDQDCDLKNPSVAIAIGEMGEKQDSILRIHYRRGSKVVVGELRGWRAIEALSGCQNPGVARLTREMTPS